MLTLEELKQELEYLPSTGQFVRLKTHRTFTGIRQRSNGKWGARIFVQGKHIDLGTYTSFADAVAARQLANKEYGFHENHGQ